MAFSMAGFQGPRVTAAGFATGDVENNFRKLTRLLTKVHYPTMFARERVIAGETAVFVPMLRYAISAMSHKLTRYLLHHSYQVYATSDVKFMEMVYRACIHTFHYYPVLTQMQFMNPPTGYAERKIVLVTQIIQACLSKHAELTKEQKMESTLSSSQKRRAREEAQARLTQAHRVSDALVREEIVLEGEPNADIAQSVPSSTRGRRASRDDTLNSSRSASASMSASSSSRARSASATRTQARVPLSASRKKSSAFASGARQRPQTAATPIRQLEPFSTSNASFMQSQNPTAAAASTVDVSFQPLHSVDRTVVRNGDAVQVEPDFDMEALMARAEQRAQSAEGAQSAHVLSPVKKAWLHDHTVGSSPLNVVGFVAEGVPAPAPAGSPSRAKARHEYTRAQDVAKLRRKEAEAELQAEEDRMKLLKLQHQEYAVQNSPHIEHDTPQETYDDGGHEEVARPALVPSYLADSSASHGTALAGTTTAAVLSASARSRPARTPAFADSRAQASFIDSYSSQAPASASFATTAAGPSRSPERDRHVVGDEAGLNQSFGLDEAEARARTRKQIVQTSEAAQKKEPRVQPAASHSSHFGPSASAASVASMSASKFIPVNSIPPAAASSSSSASSSFPDATIHSAATLLSVSRPVVSTPLEGQLYSMLETIAAKMASMQTEMQRMESKMERMAERETAIAAGGSTQRSSHGGGGMTSAQASFMASAAPREVAHAALAAGSSERFHPLPWHPAPPRSRDGGPHDELLVPHPSHAYHPGVSYFGPGRKENVNVIQTGPTGGPGQTHAAHERHPVITTDLAARYASSRSQHSTHPHPLPLESRDPTSHSGGYGKNFSSSPQRRSPVRVVQPTSHETAPVQGNGVIPSSLRFGASSSAASVAPPSFQSSFDPAHPVSGSAALASGHELQSTDSFIERLKQRLAQTNELIGTVRRTQISLEAQEHQ